MLLIIAGMHRSASTLAYQIGCAVTKDESNFRIITKLPKGIENSRDWHVVKTHGYHPEMLAKIESEKVAVVITIRDPRDTVTSMMKLNNESFDVALNRAVFGVNRHTLWGKNSDKLYTFRYEDFYNNLSVLINGISNAVGIEVDGETISELSERFSFKNNRARSRKITKTESDFMFPGHIQDGIVGKWKISLSQNQIEQVQNFIGRKWFNENGYELWQ